jgi:hypothetical protein
MNRVSDFMNELSEKLMRQKEITESSAISYIKNLYNLNNKEVFNNLTFLKNTSNIENALNSYKDNTKKTILSGIVSVLSLYKDKPTYKKIYQHYFDLMMNKAHEMKDNNINEKSKAQNENWINWEQVLNVKKNLKNIVDTFASNKFITAIQFDYLLGYLILSLYTDIPPRRNQDYIDMYFVNNYTDGLDSNRNYLDWANKKLVFLKYKTAKKYGKQVIDISDNKDLLDALTLYLKFHPLNPSQNLKKLPKNTNFKLLVYSNGSYLDAVNSITRILNKIFGRNIGSSMLRHIYLSSKYDIKDMKDDAEKMGHSLNEQRQYIKEGSGKYSESSPEQTEVEIPIKQVIKPMAKAMKSKHIIV